MRHTAAFLAVLLAASVAQGAAWPSAGVGGGTIDSLGDISPSLCTSDKVLYRNTTEWVCLNLPAGGDFTFTMIGDSGTQLVVNTDTFDIEGGAGILTDVSGLKNTIVTASEEAGFLKDNGAAALTCSSGEGSMVVHNTEPLAYCDGNDDLQYSAYGDTAGDATGIEDGLVVNADVHAAAAIAGTKIVQSNASTRGTIETAIAAEVNAHTSAALAVSPLSLKDADFGAGAGDLGGTFEAPTVTAVQMNAIAVITDIHDDIKTGGAGMLVTATTGLAEECAEWDISGNLQGTGEPCGSGSGGTLSVEEEDSEVDAAVVILNFLGADFDLNEPVDHQIDIIIAELVTRDDENPHGDGDIEGDYDAGLTIKANAVGVDEISACDSLGSAQILEFATDGTPSCKTAIQTSLTTPEQYEVLVYNGSAWVDGDIDLSQAQAVGTSVLGIANGGTNNSGTLTDGGILMGGGASGAFTATAVMTDGQLLIGDGTTGPTRAQINADDGLLMTASAGGIELDLDLNTTGDGDGADGSSADGFSGMEFTATGEVALLQGCDNTEGLFWTESTHKWECGAPTTAEVNDAEAAMDTIEIDEVILGTATDTAKYITLSGLGGTDSCAGSTDALQYDSSDQTFACKTDVAAGGVVTGLIGDDDANATTSAELTVYGIAEGSAGAGIATDTNGTALLSLSWTPEITRNFTWGDGGEASLVHTYAVTGTGDPVWTVSDGLIAVTGTTVDITTTGEISAALSLYALGGVVYAGATDVAGSLTLYDGTDSETVSIDVPSSVTTYTLTLPDAVPAGEDYLLEGDGSGNLSWFDIAANYAKMSVNLSQFASTSSPELYGVLEDETGSSAGTPLAVFNQNPVLDDVSFGAAGVKIVDDGDGEITLSSLGGGSGEAHSLTINLDDTSNIIVFTSSTATQFDFPDNSIDTADLMTEVRSMVWNAGAMTTDGTECSAPAEVGAIGGAGGPAQWGILCPMGTSETDGFLYGSTVLPGGFDNTTDVNFLATAVIDTDAGAGTFHGSIGIQCVGDAETVGTSWGTEADVDFEEPVGDVQWDLVYAASDAALDISGCEPNDTLWWRLKMCDTDATSSTNCASPDADVDDFTILSNLMAYTTDIGD